MPSGHKPHSNVFKNLLRNGKTSVKTAIRFTTKETFTVNSLVIFVGVLAFKGAVGSIAAALADEPDKKRAAAIGDRAAGALALTALLISQIRDLNNAVRGQDIG